MAKIDYVVDIDLNDNHLLNAVIQTVNALPATGVVGKVIYYTTDSTLRYWDGTQWQVLATGGIVPLPSTATPAMDGTASAGSSGAWARGDHVHPTDTTREAVANKDAANGYAGLDANAKVPYTKLPTGNTANTVPLIKGTIGAGEVLKYSSSDGGFIAASIAAVLTYKGSCTYAQLPSTGQQVGDVWNVTDAHGTTPAGTNYAWNGTAWDPLGGDVDLSNYVTDDQLSTTLAGYAIKSHASSNQDTYGAASETKYGHAKASTTTPAMDGTASVGLQTAAFARGDHVHPTDTSRASAADLSAHTGDSDIHVTAAQKAAWNQKATVKSYTLRGDGTMTSFSVTDHFTAAICQVFDGSSGAEVIPSITRASGGFTITFNTAPANNKTYTVIIAGF